MHHVQERARYSVEVNIIAMFYLNQVCISGHVPVTVHSWRALWSTAIIIAQKTWEEVPIRTTGFADILPSMSRVSKWSPTITQCIIYLATTLIISIHVKNL